MTFFFTFTGTCKIERNCTATIKVSEAEDKKVTVDVCHSHYGHRSQLQHIKFSKRQRREIAAKVEQGVSRDKILSDIRKDVGTIFQKIHLVEKKDINNIAKSFNLFDFKRHDNDQDSVAAWIHEWKNQPDNPVLFYKLQGEHCRCFEDDDFIIVLQTEFQQQLLQKFGNDGICVDTTHGTNMYDFLLTTVMVVDDFGTGQPVGWCMANHETFPFVKVFFDALIKNSGNFSPKWFMSDLAPQYYDAFSEVSNSIPKKLFCTWHVDKAWREEIKKMVSGSMEVEAEVYKMLRVILQQTEVNVFEDSLDGLVDHLSKTKETKAFADYFVKFWVPKKRHWGYCYRVGCGINTNMFVEAFHRVLKYNYMKGKQNRRVDACLFSLIKVNQDRVFQRLIRLTKGKPGFRMNLVRKRHVNSLQLDTETVVKDSTNDDVSKWIIQSENGDNTYVVTCHEDSCSNDNCQLKCHDCSACSHFLSCTCIDFLMNNISCKHVHLVQRVRVPVQDNQDHFSHEEGSEDYRSSEIEKTFTHVRSGKVSDIENTKERVITALTQLITEVRNAIPTDEEPLKCLEQRISAARNTFISLKENKLESLKERNHIAPNKNVARQRRFQSTKAKRKPTRTRLAKRTILESQNILWKIHQQGEAISLQYTSALLMVSRNF